MQRLDVLRALRTQPEGLHVFLAEVMKAKGGNSRLDRWIDALRMEFSDLSDLEFRSRSIVDKMALALQASPPVRSRRPSSP